MILSMSAAYAAQITQWTYADEYAVYSFSHNDDSLRELLNGDYYACLSAEDRLMGYFCFGSSAQIPAIEPNAYPPDALDIGLGLRPDLCGGGRGVGFISEGISFAKTRFRTNRIRLTVAVWNVRAIRAYEKAGFQHTATVTHRISQQVFRIMYRTA